MSSHIVMQLSVFIENRVGRVADATKVLSDAGCNVRGFAISDTSQFGIVRIVVDNPGQGAKALRNAGFTVKKTPIIVVRIDDDHPGGLAAILQTISDSGVNVEYMYSLISTLLALNVDDVDLAAQLLEDTNVKVVSQSYIESV